MRNAGVATPVGAPAVEAPIGAELIEYGRSVEGRPLTVVRIAGQSSVARVRPAALMMGVSQGIEELGFIEAMPDVLRTGRVPGFMSRDGEDVSLDGVRQFLRDGGILYVVPVVNPDGRTARTYENANGINLNRDWTAQSQPETSSLIRFLEAEEAEAHIDLRLVVDYHIGIPRLLYPRGNSCVPIPFNDLVEHLTYHEMMPDRIRKAPISLFDSIRETYADQPVCEVLNDCVVSPRCYNGEWSCGCLHSDEWDGGRCIAEPRDPVAIERAGLSNDYFYDRFGSVAFVYEADLDVDFGNVEDHARWWDASLQYIATGERIVADSRFEARDVVRVQRDLVRADDVVDLD